MCSKDTLDRFYACSLECLTFYQRNATEKLEAVVWNGWCWFFPDVCQRGKQMVDFTFLLKFITVEIYQSDLGEEKDASSLWIMVFQLQKYLNDLLQNIVLRTRKEERNGGRGRKEEKKKKIGEKWLQTLMFLLWHKGKPVWDKPLF